LTDEQHEFHSRTILQTIYPLIPQVLPCRFLELDNQVGKWLDGYIIKEYDGDVLHNNPLTVVKKANGGGWRVCLDFRELNAHLDYGDTTFIPLIDELFDQVTTSKSSIFSILDLKDAYLKLPLLESAKWTTSFKHKGKVFCFNRAPFGIRFLPALFSKLMATIMRKFGKFAVNYMDDILVFSDSVESHAKHLKTIIEELTKFNLTINEAKSRIALRSVKVLGHILEDGKILIDKTKLDAVVNFPQPSTRKQKMRFVGLIEYFRRYIPLCERPIE
jgi:putative transposase